MKTTNETETRMLTQIQLMGDWGFTPRPDARESLEALERLCGRGVITRKGDRYFLMEK